MSRHLFLGTIATASSLAEVFIAPKPGLVDRFGPGAHRDMDFSTFLLSACALAPFWQEQALTGLQGIPPEEALAHLRKTGIEMDAAMFTATSGINTHKGLIFALSLLLYGAGRCLFLGEPLSPEIITSKASAAVEGCCDRELSALSKTPPGRPLSSGERLFLEHGLTGIRGEAERGFPTVVRFGITSYRHALTLGATPHDSGLFCLFNLMLHGEDTNIVARKGFRFWKETYPQLVTSLLNHEVPYSQKSIEAFNEADAFFSDSGISPGGAADMLTCTIFLHECGQYLENVCQHSQS
ncbi:MAG: triphosphoribosyl-dephospho-CoA synthase [Thermovirgaceae bacterium]|nr:triphosphoribosyl-dephospho-CoA synthase [Thermovirgaceae bacterium]